MSKFFNSALWKISLFVVFGFPAVQNVAAQTTPEAVIKTFYNGYIRLLGKNIDPLGKRSALKKHLTARVIKEIPVFEASHEADYFMQSQEFFAEWENKFTVSKPIIAGTGANAIVTFPEGYPRVKVTLKRAAGVWKIDRVQEARQR